MSEVKVGQLWRNPDDGYLMKVVALKPPKWAFVRHPNSKQASMQTLIAWFDHWELVRDA